MLAYGYPEKMNDNGVVRECGVLDCLNLCPKVVVPLCLFAPKGPECGTMPGASVETLLICLDTRVERA